MNKKILLIYPNTANRSAITTAVPILLGIAKSRNWETSYFDTSNYEKGLDSIQEKEKTGGFKPGLLTMSREPKQESRLLPDLQATIDNFQPDIVAITAMSCEYEYLMQFWDKIRIPDKAVTIIGGIHSTFSTEDVLKSGFFDLVVQGQGEKTFPEILKAVEHNQSLTNIPGSWHYDKSRGQITENPLRELLDGENLWNIECDLSFFDDSYFQYPFDGKIVRMYWMEVARGCPYSCTYCGNSILRNMYKGLGRYISSRPIDEMFSHFRKMVDEYKIDIFNFTAECFLANPKEWLREFAANYKKYVRKPFLIQTRAETVTQENIDILKSCGAPFFQVGLGVESGSKRILNDICNRKTPVDKIIAAYDLLNSNDIRTNAYFMIGFPTETRDEIFESIELCRRINSDINSVAIFQPLPGLAITRTCIEKGYITGEEPIATFTGNSILNMPHLPKEEIANLRRTFMLYAKLPKEYYPEIEKCEKDYDNNRDLFDSLVQKRWELTG